MFISWYVATMCDETWNLVIVWCLNPCVMYYALDYQWMYVLWIVCGSLWWESWKICAWSEYINLTMVVMSMLINSWPSYIRWQNRKSWILHSNIWWCRLVTKNMLNKGLTTLIVTFWPLLCDYSRCHIMSTICDSLTYRHIRSYLMWRYTTFSSQGTFSDGRYVTTLMMVDFRHMILSMTVSVLYMTISFCHGNQIFL
jgi:hypothetical protein